MTAQKLINNNIPILKPSDTVEKALEIMLDNKLNELISVNEKYYCGIYSEEYLLGFDDLLLLENIEPQYPNTYVENSLQIIELLKIFNNNQSPILAVLDANSHFVGIVQKNEVFENFIKQLNLTMPGGLIEIKLKELNSSIAEIIHLIEAEHLRVNLMYQIEESNNIETFTTLTLKLNNPNISNVVNALARHGYDVSSYFSTEPVSNLEKDRYDLLMKYLSI